MLFKVILIESIYRYSNIHELPTGHTGKEFFYFSVVIRSGYRTHQPQHLRQQIFILYVQNIQKTVEVLYPVPIAVPFFRISA